MDAPKLTISILISNKEEYIEKCLNSIKNLRERVSCELLLTDTGCDDKIRYLMEQHADRILDFPWQDDFSAARNVGLREAKGEWFLYLDDDEWFEDTKEIEDFLLSEEEKKYNVAFYIQRNYTDKEGKNYVDARVDRLLRKGEHLHFENRIHEAYTGIEIGEKKMLSSYVHHFGYVYENREEMEKKYRRNQILLDRECKEHPKNTRLQYQRAMNPMVLEEWEQACKVAEEVIAIDSPSEYWDACHTLILYCLKMQGKYDQVIEKGESFLKKKLCPYDTFGTWQYLVEAYWRTGDFEKACLALEEAGKHYRQYKNQESYFNKQQLSRREFLEEKKLTEMLAYGYTAALYLKKAGLLEEIQHTIFAKEYKMLQEDNNLQQWIEKVKEQLQIKEELKFPDSFFQGETRNGFYIEPMMKHAWAANMEILYRVDAICQKYQIPYFAGWGTLLGAVRHQGFIPWDDDIDICMKRQDAERLFAVLNQEDVGLKYLNNYNMEGWGGHATKIVNTTEFFVDRKRLKEYHGFPFTASIDIFMVDYIPREKELGEELKQVLRLIMEACQLKEELKEYSPFSLEFQRGMEMQKQRLKEIQRICNMEFSQEIPTDQELRILYEEVCGLYQEEESDFLTQMDCYVGRESFEISKEAYGKCLRVPFEHIEISVPVGYDEILRYNYGDDYMTPMNVGAGHDYPFYGTLIEALSEKRGEDSVEDTEEYVKEVSVGYYEKFLKKDSTPRLDIKASDAATKEEQRWFATCELLEEIKEICHRRNLTYFAVGDTLQEAYKTGDKAPLQGQLRLAMKRTEYVDFMNHLHRELSPWFNYKSVYGSEDASAMETCIYSDSYKCDRDAYGKRFHGCMGEVFLTIEPIDVAEPETQRDEMRSMLIGGLLTTAKNVGTKPPYTQEELTIAKQWKDTAGIAIDTENSLQREFVKAADQVAGSYQGEGSQLRMWAELQQGKSKLYLKEWFAETEELKLYDTKIQVPIGYEKLVK